MALTGQLIFLIAFALITASLPFLTDRKWFIGKADKAKKFWQILIEWAFMFALTALFAFLLERRVYGFNHEQQWEFWVVVLCLYAVFATPGYLYRYVWR